MKKHTNKKVILVLLATMFMFFSVFKYIKGKSFFDTIVEYTNSIYSINADMVNATNDNILLTEEQFINAEYIDYKQINDDLYIAKKEDSQSMYLYNLENKEETLFDEISNDVTVSNINANREFVVWLETDNDSITNEQRNWSVYAKSISTNQKFLIDSGEFEQGYVDKTNRLIFPDGFNLQNNNLVYRRYKSETEKRNNIKTQKIVSQIIYYNLNTKEEIVIDSSNDLSAEIVYSPVINGDNIIWQNIILDEAQNTKTTELYIYNLNSKKNTLKFKTNKIKSIDIQKDSIVIATADPSELIILNTNNDSSKILLYKGSKAEKNIAKENENIQILKTKFITSNFILLDVTNGGEVETLVYDIEKEVFLNFDNYIKSTSELNEGVFFDNDSYRFVANLGFVGIDDKDEQTFINTEIAQKNEEEIIKYIDENNIRIYHKINKYILK